MAVVFDGKCLLLLVILALIPRRQTQSCSSNLTHTVVYEGSPASFSRVINSQSVQWEVIPSSNVFNLRQIITNYDDVVVSQFNTAYAVTPSELTIFNATVAPQESMPISTAGLYTIKYQDPNCSYGANLIVIRSGPVCSYDASDPNSLTLSCSVYYAESSAQPNNPVFTWKNSTSMVKQEQPIPSQNGSYLKRSVSRLSIDRSDVTKYECQLTFSSTPQSPLNYVTTTAPNFTASCFLSRDVYVVPTYGPAAGGTVVIIMAEWMELENISISAVYIGQNLQADISCGSTGDVLVTTPAIENELQINQQLPIILEIFPTSTNITTGKYFTYKPNASINDVSPRDLFISGGIPLNISGTSLDSAAQPMVRAEVVIHNGSVVTYYNQSFSTCLPPTQNGTQMICLSPLIYIRDDFLQQLFGQTNPYSNNKRKRETILSYGWKREDRAVLHDAALMPVRSKRPPVISTNETYLLLHSEDRMQIYVGIIFDGFRKYEKNILRDSGGSFRLCSEPKLSCEGDIEFDRNFITIQGGDLTQCYGPSDYTVRIGNGICTVTNLTDNALTCSPPITKPQQTGNNSYNNCGKNFAVIVELGAFKVYGCSCLRYPNDDTTKLIIIIATTVGSFVVVLIIITVIVVVVIKSKKAKKQAPTREFKGNQVKGNRYTSSDHHIRNDRRSTTDGDSRVTYKRPIDTIYLSPTPGESYTTQISGSFSESRNQMSYEPDNYLSPVEDHNHNGDETGCYETTIG